MTVESKFSGLLEKIWLWLTSGIGWSTWDGILKWIIILVTVLSIFCWAIGYLLEKLAKALEAYKNSGLPVTFDHKKKAQIRRRRQFCNVLKSDLATLAKAENWNDQYFTDLEAEVEAEGGYYATFLHRLIRRQSFGLRRVYSLIQALESSTEKALLLVGEAVVAKVLLFDISRIN